MAGLSTVLVMLFVAWAGVALETRRVLDAKTASLLSVWLGYVARTHTFYDSLEAITETDCGGAHLRQLNTLIYNDRQIINVWFFPDGGTKTSCSTSFGRLPVPHDFGPPLNAKLFTDGREAWYRVPFEAVDTVDRVTIIKKGRYGLTFAPTGGLKEAGSEQFFASSPNTPFSALYHFNGDDGLLEKYRENWGPVFGDTYGLACGPGDPRLCYLTMIPIEQVFRQTLPLLGLFGLFSVFAAFLVYQRVNRAVLEGRSARGRVRRAIAKGGAGFEPYYQPILTLDGMTCAGCEVLARFQDSCGKLMPDEFIGLIQDQNLTWEFTEIIISRALDDLRPVLASRPGFKVSVNFFQADLDDTQIQALVQSPVFTAANEAGISLCCEILETGIGKGTSIAKSLAYLRGIGCQIAIDDFGTGYSNLAQIYALKPDLLKIDKMFIEDLSTSADSARSAFLHAILDIADAHDLKVCAEGVETIEQLSSLKEQKVEFAQGFYFAKPMPLGDFARYLEEQAQKQELPEDGKIIKLSPAAS
ncbi:EAL domain-containing protein [Roseibium sp.]|uniref:EAL domain-containing protein n=3 Tax=Roseibium sp. TaxID=1936156 RepID=UPI003D1162ED